MSPYWLAILQIILGVIAAKVGGPVVNTADAALRLYAAAKAAYEAETGQPLDESKVPPFVPIP